MSDQIERRGDLATIELPDGVRCLADPNRRLSHDHDDKTVACPECDHAGGVRVRIGKNVQFAPECPLRCEQCGWAGHPDAVVIRPSRVGTGANRGAPSPPAGSLARKLIDTDVDEVSLR